MGLCMRRIEIQLTPLDLTFSDGACLSLLPADALALVGPHIDVVVSPLDAALNQTNAPSVAGRALIDTGAAFTGVDESVCKMLGIGPSGRTNIFHTGGKCDRDCYPVAILFPNTGIPLIQEVRAISVDLAGGNQPPIVILGRDLLSKMKFTYDGINGRFWFEFDEFDPPATIVTPNLVQSGDSGT